VTEPVGVGDELPSPTEIDTVKGWLARLLAAEVVTAILGIAPSTVNAGDCPVELLYTEELAVSGV
jgi:hypothetical protein